MSVKKKNKVTKWYKKLLILCLVIILFLIGTFFFDKKSFYSLKDTLIVEINKITEEIKKTFNEYRKGNEKKYENIDFNGDLFVYFLDVGQAESILIKSDEEYMLIDAGNNNDGEKIVDYFKYLGIKEFKYVFGTHAHEDHVGGMDNIIKSFKIQNFYMPSDTTTTQTYLEILNELERKKIKYQTPSIGTKLQIGKAQLEVISIKENQEDLNDTSIVLKLTYKDISFLFTGDITSNVEREILNKNIESTVLKVPHHGSKYSNSAQFLKKVDPKYAIISCGQYNEYFHPHQVVLDKLEKMNVEIFRTDLLGTIVASTDGKNIDFKTIKTYTDGG